MRFATYKVLKYIVVAIVAVIVVVFWSRFRKQETTPHIRDYEEIAKSGLLNAVTEYNAISFYVDGDTVSGFHLDLIEAFAHDRGWQVAVTPEMSFEKRLQGLSNGTYDIIAFGIPVTSQLKDSILLTNPIILTRQVLVQRKAESDSATYIRSQLDLGQKTLHVVKGSPAIRRIQNLGNEIADTIYIQEVEQYSSEQLMAMVAYGDIDYAVTDEAIAKAYLDSFPQLDINTGISFTMFYSWGVNKQSPQLLDSLNQWLGRFTKTSGYKRIYKKYYSQ